MMIIADGYALSYEKSRNKISICLPQTIYTTTNTIEPVIDRRVDVEEEDLAIILGVAMAIFNKKEVEGDSNVCN